jgi:hypothetical protein
MAPAGRGLKLCITRRIFNVAVGAGQKAEDLARQPPAYSATAVTALSALS